MLDVLINSLPIFVAIGLGKFFSDKKLLPANASTIISTLAFKLIGPFFVFNVLYGISIQNKNSYLFIEPLIVFFSVLVASFLAGKYLFKLKSKKLGAMILCLITFGAGSVYPFVDRNFSERIFQDFVIVDTFSFLIFLIVGSIIAFNFGKKKQIDIKEIVLRPFKDPFTLTMILTFLIVIFKIKVPSVIVETSKFFKESFFLLASLLVGMGLKLPDRKIVFNLAKIYLFRTIFIICLIALLFSLNKAQIKPFYLVFLAKYSVMAVVYAKEQGLDYQFASQLVLFSMIAELVFYPIIITVLQ